MIRHSAAECDNRFHLNYVSAVQTVAARLKKMDRIASRNGKYFIPDILLRLYLQKFMNPDTMTCVT